MFNVHSDDVIEFAQDKDCWQGEKALDVNVQNEDIEKEEGGKEKAVNMESCEDDDQKEYAERGR